VPLVEVQLTVNISVLGGRPVEVASMTNVLQKVDVHDANVAVADGERVSPEGRSGANRRKPIGLRDVPSYGAANATS
jgi:hypothetical protein